MRESNQDIQQPAPARLRCAIYTRKSTEEGLEPNNCQRVAVRFAPSKMRRAYSSALGRNQARTPESYHAGSGRGSATRRRTRPLPLGIKCGSKKILFSMQE